MVILSDDIKPQISRRLALERERLGLEQTEIRDALDIALATISRYENAKRLPDLGIAKQLSDLGYDMSYVISGRRLGESASDLTDDEMQWLELYRNSQRRAELVRLIKTYESME
ncbi:helix-turn-helix domain-containing protein [Psychrobacter sp. 72-O-c]|uniref:helix-turn-helix domain-containing protein n=1 Tax=Psychrobacter sp. 72-O-c TaxID=2774125 RepID=UPI00191AB0FA|nr:helix-turn-helix transcriptional regulator [Psychrobacter sp. 72-O-c]